MDTAPLDSAILRLDTKAATAARDAAALLSNVGARDYLETDTTVTWLRREHPEARIVTTMLFEGPITAYVIESETRDGKRKIEIVDTPNPKATPIDTRLAIFRAELTIDGEIVATGHGEENRASFNGYLEKAESIAIRRMCVNAGYSLEMLRQLGFALQRAPENRLSPVAGAGEPDQRRGNPQPARPAPPQPVAPKPAPPAAVAPKPAPALIEAIASGARSMALSGEFGPAEDAPNSPLGTVQAAPAADRAEWRKHIAAVYEGNSAHGPQDVDNALAILCADARLDVWRWIILLQTVQTSKELNKLMSMASAASRSSSDGKITGPAWSAATAAKAQDIAAATAA